MSLSELLESYRTTEYHYPDIVWQDMRVKVLKPILTEELADLTEERFRELLLSEWFMKPRIAEQMIENIIRENDFNEVKLKLLDLFLGKSPLEKRLQAVIDLNGIGPYIASQLLSAVDDEFIIYHQNVLEGIRALLPHLDDWGILHTNIRNAREYSQFNDICKSIRDRFGFKSLGEVHEFFWHGYANNWEFGSPAEE